MPKEITPVMMHYKCWSCETEWLYEDECVCDDRCPKCDKTNEYVRCTEDPLTKLTWLSESMEHPEIQYNSTLQLKFDFMKEKVE